MALPGKGIFVVQGEIAMLVTAMRRSSRWGSHSNQNEDYDNLMKMFVCLRDVLKQIDDLRVLDPNVFFSPFLEVIRSEETTGPVTSIALSAVNKFLSYGLIDPFHPSVPATVENIADAVTHARFVGTDHSSDGIVLMKILQVLRTLLVSPEGTKMTDESVCEIMLSCFRICFETRLSELLRRNAEQCLRDMTQLVFMRLPQFKLEAFDAISSGGTFSLQRRTDKVKRRSRVAVSQDSLRKFGEQQEPDVSSRKSSVISPTSCADVVNPKLSSKEKDAQLLCEEEVTIEPPSENYEKPTKTHIRHSSMDLQSNANNSITELLEKCVGSTDSTSDKNEMDAEEEKEADRLVSDSPVENAVVSKEDEIESGELINKADSNAETLQRKDNTIKIEKDYISPRGIRFTVNHYKDDQKPYGLVCVRELFRFLVMICNPLDNQNTPGMLQLGLTLIQTALEVGGNQLARHPALLTLVKDPLSRNLISLLSSDRVTIVALDLQVAFLLFESMRPHLKLQMEAYFKRLTELIISENAKNTYDVKEITHLALESLTQMFRIPGLCTELFLNYDCDIYCSNLFEDITKMLSKNVVSSSLPMTHMLSLDTLIAIIESIEANSQEESINVLKPQENCAIARTKSESCEHVSIDMEGTAGVSSVLDNISHYVTHQGRYKPSEDLPNDEQLEAAKNQKRWIAAGTELFNQKPEKGIEYLQEHGILESPLNPHQIAMFLRENSGLDKKMIGEYICKRSSTSVLTPTDHDGDYDSLSMANANGTSAVSVLSAFANSFEFQGLRIDQALRLYLETFRLPGEAPLIFLVMEHFAERWHTCNGSPFANTDAAFRLAYSIIMLNMDQHNHNAKKLNIPMKAEDFVRNLRGCNGSGDFDQTVLEAVFNAIKNEEIVMPAERSGLVKENYLWKVLLRRTTTPYFITPPGRYDAQLFNLTWGPTITALSSSLERSTNTNVSGSALNSVNSSLVAATDALEGMGRCAALAARLGHTDTLDTIVLGLCKFTGLLGLPDGVSAITVASAVSRSLGGAALTAAAAVSARHAACLRAAWPPLFSLLTELYRARLLTGEIVETDDLSSTDVKSLYRTSSDEDNTAGNSGGLFSSLYSYIAMGEVGPTAEERRIIKSAEETVQTTNLYALFVTETRFLPLEGLQELVKQVCTAGAVLNKDEELPNDVEDVVIFYLELLMKIVLQNRDRVSLIWPTVSEHISSILTWGAELPVTGLGASYTVRCCTSSLLRAAVQLLRVDRCTGPVLQTVQRLLLLKKEIFMEIAEMVSEGVYELVRTAAQNIHSEEDWGVLFSILAAAGAGRLPVPPDQSPTVQAASVGSNSLPPTPPPVPTESDEDAEGGWIMVGTKGGISMPPAATARCCAALALVVRDVAHVTPHNFPACVACVRTFVDAALKTDNMDRIPTVSSASKANQRQRPQTQKKAGSAGSRRAPQSPYYSEEDDDEEESDSPDIGQMICVQLLDLIHTLHSRTAGVFAWWREEASEEEDERGAAWADLWTTAWLPLLRGIATLCLDVRKQVWSTALAYLQRALLAPGLGALGGREWEQCCRLVLFPLLSALIAAAASRRRRAAADAAARANTILCKVFLHHLSALSSQSTFPWVWLRVVSLQRALLVGSPGGVSNGGEANGSPDDALREAALESLKNMILVMDSVKIFGERDDRTPLWNGTWQSIGEFLPNLHNDLFPQEATTRPDVPPTPPQTPPQSYQQQPPTSQAAQLPQQTLQPSVDTLTRGSSQKGGSIILQPPMAPSQFHSPLFTHLGQMVSTPIGVTVPVSQVSSYQQYPISRPKLTDTPKISPIATLTTQLPVHINYPCIVAQGDADLKASPLPPLSNLPQKLEGEGAESEQENLAQREIIDNSKSQDLSIEPNVREQVINFDEDITALSEDYLQAQAEINASVRMNSLYVEYLTDPYSIAKQSSCELIKELSNDSSEGFLTPAMPLQKSASATASPQRDQSSLKISKTQPYASSDNVQTPLVDGQSSSIFNFAHYFMSDSKSIPPGSEILFGDQFLPANEG